MKNRLGTTVRDPITGFEGVVTGVVDYITGCRQLLVAPKGVHPETKQPYDSRWFDDQRMQDVTYPDGEAYSRFAFDNSVTPGPDKPAPVR